MNAKNVDTVVIEQKANERRFQHLLSTFPEAVRDSFNDVQLEAIKKGMTETAWKKHPIDFRNSVSFFSYQYYLVFIAGRDGRQMTREEIRFKRLSLVILLIFFITFSTLLGLLVIYLIKSAMGIDIFPHFSLGIWTWFKGAF